jgi:hypothetical protein
MSGSLTPRVALITGSNRGIGFERICNRTSALLCSLLVMLGLSEYRDSGVEDRKGRCGCPA